MATEDFKRKLTAIFSADVAGYSRLMGEDELATIETLTSHKEIMGKLIRRYRGRVVDSIGDNLLAEFASVVDAVQCAVEVQQVLSAKNETLPENRRMYFRIGINLGDVVEEGERIYGDGVNVAARVESLAEGGGISISGTAYDQLGKKLPLGYEYLGEQSVKNIEKPVRVYRVLTEAEAAGKVIGEKRGKPQQLRWAAIGGVVVLILVAGALAIWNFYFRPAFEPASVEKMAFSLPDKPSIAVMPFLNMTAERGQEFFADGLSEGIITALAKVPQLFIIGRDSTFSYKGKAVKAKQVSEELGVQYVLEGSVQKAGDRVRVTAQLIDALKGHHLWAERYDRELKDVFAIQDEITKKIITVFHVKLTHGEWGRIASKGTENLEAYLKSQEAAWCADQSTRESLDRGKKLSEEALALDPDFPHAYHVLGVLHMLEALSGFSKNPKDSLELANKMQRKVIELDESFAMARAVLGFNLLMLRKYDEAIVEAEKAYQLLPGSSSVLYWYGTVLTNFGRAEEAVPILREVLRLEPKPMNSRLRSLSVALRDSGQYQEAIEWIKKTIQREPDSIVSHLILTSTYAYAGREEEAKAAAKEILRINPKFSIEQFMRASPQRDAAARERFAQALKNAGLPEKPPLALPDKPSIAVLPFVNMSGDPEQEYFSDGITEDIITNLSKVSGILVISRNSSFLYKGKNAKIQEVSRDLGVRYVLEGSVRRGGDRVRITAQLIDGKTEHHVWADNYDRELKDIFSVQDEVTWKVVSELAVALTATESDRLPRKHTENFEAYDTYLRAKKELYGHKKKDTLKAIEMSQRVIDLDPNFAGGYQMQSFLLSRAIRFALSDSPREDLEKALKLAQKAISVDDKFPLSYMALASVYLMQGKHEDALAAANRAAALLPGDSDTIVWLGYYLNWVGRGEEAVAAVKKARELNPMYLYGGWPVYHDFMAHACFTAGLYEDSISSMKKAIEMFGPSTTRNPFLIASYSMLGRKEEAKESAQQWLKANPKFSLSSWKFGRLYKRSEDKDRLYEALRKAGLPE